MVLLQITIVATGGKRMVVIQRWFIESLLSTGLVYVRRKKGLTQLQHFRSNKTFAVQSFLLFNKYNMGGSNVSYYGNWKNGEDSLAIATIIRCMVVVSDLKGLVDISSHYPAWSLEIPFAKSMLQKDLNLKKIDSMVFYRCDNSKSFVTAWSRSVLKVFHCICTFALNAHWEDLYVEKFKPISTPIADKKNTF